MLGRALVAALVSLSGCCEHWLTGREITVAPETSLRAIAVSDPYVRRCGRDTAPPDYDNVYYLVDAAGHVSILDYVEKRRSYERKLVARVQVSSHPLVDVAAVDRSVWVVDESAVVFESTDEGRTWASHPLDAGLAPRGILIRTATDETEHVVVYGDDFVRARPLGGGDWQAPEAPAGGWGRLRTDTPGWRVMLLGDGDDLLIADDPLGSWQRIEAPTEVLALGIGVDRDSYIVGGRDGILLQAIVGETGSWTDVTWTPIDEGLHADVVAIEERWVLTNAGEIAHLVLDGPPETIEARTGVAGVDATLVAFGANGPVLVMRRVFCRSVK